MDRFGIEGPWGVSVHATPHRSLHSVASTISLGLQNHGPSFGSGGAPGQESSALLSAVGLLQSGPWHGVWVVCSGWWPELEFDVKGQPTSASTCVAAVLGLVSQATVTTLGHLRIELSDEAAADSSQTDSSETVRLTEFLADESRSHSSWRCRPSPWMRMELALSAAELPKPHFALRGGNSSRSTARQQTPGTKLPPV
jgi:hypothetical protein